MTDRHINFRGYQVCAALGGRLSQARLVMKPPYGTLEYLRDGTWRPICLKFFPGDRLYVREAHSLHNAHGTERHDGKRWGPWGGLPTAVSPDGEQIAYFREGFDRCAPRWRPSIHMPRWASRLTLTVTDVRVQRLQEISDEDAWAEGCKQGDPWDSGDGYFPAEEPSPDGKGIIGWDCARDWYADLWDHLHGPSAWAANPWVVALTFTVQHGNIDQLAVRP